MLIEEIVSLRCQKLVIDLIVMDIPDFDMILDIDFLSNYETEIDYKKSKVQFSLDNSEEFTFEEGRILSMMINSV